MRTKLSLLLILFLILTVVKIPYIEAKQLDLGFLIQNEFPTAESENTQHTRKITIHFDEDSLICTQNQNGMYFEIKGGSASKVPGKPTLPIHTQTISISQNENVVFVNVQQIQGLKLFEQPLNLLTTPIPKTIAEEDSIPKNHYIEPTPIDSECSNYNQENSVQSNTIPGIYPSHNVSYKIVINDNEKSVYLSVNPVYVFRGTIYFVTTMQLEIGLQLDSTSSVYTNEKKNSAIILTPDEFQASAKKLAAMQQANGYDSSIVLLSEIQELTPAEYPTVSVKGYSEQTAKGFLKRYDYELSAKIRSYLEEKLKHDEIDYLTLLGDALIIPPSFYHYANERSWVDSCVPTDMYYVSPFGIHGEFSFDICVGRIPVRSLQEAEKQVDKIRRYYEEIEKKESWTNGVALFGGDPFDGNYFGELILSEAANKNLFAGKNVSKYYQTEDLFTKEELLRTLTSGHHGIITVYGHGSGNELHMASDIVSSEEISKLQKHSVLPIFMSPACMNGTWDSRLIQGEEGTPMLSFSEAMILSEGASIAYIGGARSNYSNVRIEYTSGIPTLMNYTYVDTILQYTFQAMKEGKSTLGDCMKRSLYLYYTQDISTDREGGMYKPDIKAFYGSTLLGDPTLPSLSSFRDTNTMVPKINPDFPIVKETKDAFPIFPIDNGIQFTISSASALRYIYASYEDMPKRLIDQGVIEEIIDNKYTKHFMNLQKTKGCIRFESKDAKEIRIVFEARYNFDVSIHPLPYLRLLRPYETSRNTILVKNDGIYDTGAVVIETKKNGNTIHTLEIPSIPYLCSTYYDYDTQPKMGEEVNIHFTATLYERDEIFIEDNVASIQVQCTEEPIYRIGLLTSSLFDPDYGDQYLSLEKINRRFQEIGQNVELQTISCYYNTEDEISFNLLGFDALVLFDCLWHENPGNYYETFYTILSDFTKEGGKIFGVHSLHYYPLQNWFWTEKMQTFFGIHQDTIIDPHYWLDPTATITFQNQSLLSKKTYDVWNHLCICPTIKVDDKWVIEEWSSEYLLPQAEIIASSSQKGLSLLQYKENVFLYTGFFNNDNFKKEEETFSFFVDMLQYLSKPTIDPTIKSVEIVKPDSIYVGDEISVEVLIKNNGNQTISDLELLYDDKVLPIKTLYGKDTCTLETLITADEPGTNTKQFEIHSFTDDNPQNNQYVLFFEAQSILNNDTKAREQNTIWEPTFSLSTHNTNLQSVQQPSTTVFPYDYEKNLFIIDFKVTSFGIYIATPSGIHLYNNDELVESIPYPKEWYTNYSHCLLPSTRSMLEVNQKYIVINMEDTIYLMDRYTKKFIGQIYAWDCEGLLRMRLNFDWIKDMKIIGSHLFVFDSYTVSMFDLSSGHHLCREYFPSSSSIIHYGSHFLAIYTIDFSVFNLENHQIKVVNVNPSISTRLKQIKDTQACVIESSTKHNPKTKKWETVYKYAIVNLSDIINNNSVQIASEDFHEADQCLVYSKRWQYYDNKSYALLSTSFTNEVERITTSTQLCVFDENCQLKTQLFEKRTNPEIRSDNNVFLPDRVYIVPYSNRYIGQNIEDKNWYEIKDENTNTFQRVTPIYIKDHRISTISNVDYYQGKMSFLYTEKNTFGCIEYDLSKDLKTLSKPTFIQLEKKDYGRGVLTSTKDYYCVIENSHQSVVWYEKKTGKLKTRYSLRDEPMMKLHHRFPISISETGSSSNTVYVLDYWNQYLHLFHADGVQKSIPLKRFFPYGKCKNLVVDGDVFYLLNTEKSSIAIFKNGVFDKWVLPSQVGAEIISSFDISNNEILINDRYQGKTFKSFINSAYTR